MRCCLLDAPPLLAVSLIAGRVEKFAANGRSAGRSLARCGPIRGSWHSPRAVCYFSTSSASSRLRCRRNCCARSSRSARQYVTGVVGVFLFQIDPAQPDVDEWLWGIVGDFPSAYISSENANTPREALEGYVAETEAWVDAARQGQSVEELIPVNLAPTRENADALGQRLRLLRDDVLANRVGDLTVEGGGNP